MSSRERAGTVETALTPKRARELRRRLLRWYAANERPLPWRAKDANGARDPYAVWISEAMLQQTRVETVEPYWRRFLARFPDVATLAAASEDDVLAEWSGLGYYRRARALRDAARAIVERHGGSFPRARADALALPGVGPYTAGAVLSIAFDLSEPLVDGNVERVLARLFALDLPAASPQLGRATWELARELVPRTGAGDWNQALMELGALVCTPRAPACPVCPVASLCAAKARGLEGELPRARSRPAPVQVEVLALLVRRRASLLMERRPADGPMAGMWQLPTSERPAGRTTRLFPKEFPPGVREVDARGRVRLGEVRHTFTHHRIRAQVAKGSFAGKLLPPLAWVESDALELLALTGMTRKILRASFSARARA